MTKDIDGDILLSREGGREDQINALAKRLAKIANPMSDLEQLVWRGNTYTLNTPSGAVNSAPPNQAPLWRYFIQEAAVALDAAESSLSALSGA